MALMAGSRLGVYEILAPIGAGGMGDVYRARDTTLGRDVAIKVLPDAFSRDHEKLARFRREAQLLASLNHPHIATLFGLDACDGQPFLVMELVDGETLAERIARGPIPSDDAIALFIQIAEGLESAHEKGIIHRDLKPANIKVGANGKAEILDFGLAKAYERDNSSSRLSESPTVTKGTAAGVILGTAAYMSPEQARGKTVDKRTDVWSFGCCLFEALTGKTAFFGETVPDTIAAILGKEPEWSALTPATPPLVKSVLRRCLQKDSSRRIHDVADARIELEEARTETVSQIESSGYGRSVPWLWVAVIAILSAAVAGLGMWWSFGPSEDETDRVARYEISLFPGTSIANFDNASIAVSSDGSRIVYAAVDGEGIKRLYVRETDGLTSTPIPGTEGDIRGPFLSPDGERAGYYDNDSQQLKRVSLRGGRPAVICDARGAYRGGSWGDDDTIVVSSYSDGLLRGRADGGGCTNLARPDGVTDKTYYFPQILPGGEWVLHTVGAFEMDSYDDARIDVVSLRTAERRALLAGGSHARYVSSGHLVYASGETLLAAPFDVDRLKLRGPGVAIIDNVLTYPAYGGVQFACSENGILVYMAGTARGKRELVWLDRKGVARPLPIPLRGFDGVDISYDGHRLAVEIDEGTPHIWAYDVTRDTLTRLTFHGNNQGPSWTPDGQRVIYGRFKGGEYKITLTAADGSGDEIELTNGNPPISSTPDGSALVYRYSGDLWLLPMNGERTPKLFLGTRFMEGGAAFSPDGSWLAYTSDESGREEVYVTSYPDAGGKTKVSKNGGTNPVWNPNGRELFYRNGRALLAVDIVSQPSLRISSPRLLFEGDYLPSYDVRPDGEEFIMIRSVDEPLATHINVVVNWFAELERLVPRDD